MAASDGLGGISAAVATALTSFASEVERKTAARHSYELPSQAAARDAQIMMRDWLAAGRQGWPANISKSDFRAGIYDLARSSAQLRAYQQTVSVALTRHAKHAGRELASGELLLGLGALRGFFERAGSLADNIRRLSNRLGGGAAGMEAVLEASEDIARCLYGTRLDWMGLAREGLRGSTSNAAAYRPRPDTADVTSRNVLGGIDALEKKVTGARLTYEVLCEFLHPNVGDLVATTEQAMSWEDGWGTRHIRRVISFGPYSTHGQADFQNILKEAFEISLEIVELSRRLLDELSQLARAVNAITKKAQHATVKRQRHLFKRADPCPCLSGRPIRECAPSALRLG